MRCCLRDCNVWLVLDQIFFGLQNVAGLLLNRTVSSPLGRNYGLQGFVKPDEFGPLLCGQPFEGFAIFGVFKNDSSAEQIVLSPTSILYVKSAAAESGGLPAGADLSCRSQTGSGPTGTGGWSW